MAIDSFPLVVRRKQFRKRKDFKNRSDRNFQVKAAKVFIYCFTHHEQVIKFDFEKGRGLV